MTDFKTILLDDIHPDPNQPRKFYDALAMEELTQSVKEKGVLQPVLIRPNGNGYILVCGERRYRASKEAGLTDIPAVIRQLTDDEALELQIIENLQRKDVNPMEEGTAFKMLKERFSIEEIGHRVGKSATYVAQRMKLCDLIPEFQDLLFADRMKLSLAFPIARLIEKSQLELYKEARVPKDWAKKKDWELPSWIRVDNHEHELDEASFKTEDPDLYPEMGPCNKCQFNSNFNKLLFPDLQRKRICHNGVCYQIKTSRAYAKQMEDAAKDPDLLFISTSWYPDKEEKAKVKSLEEEVGIKVIEKDLVEVVRLPEPPQTWEEYFEEQKDDYDYEEMTDKEKKEREKEWKADHLDLLSEYQKDLQDVEKDKKSGRLRKAFIVAGHDSGKYVDVKVKSKKGIAKENAAAGDNPDLVMIESEITEINERSDRNKELDREKVFKKLVELFKLEGNDFLKNQEELSPDEWAAMLFAISENSYQVRDYLGEALNISTSYEGINLYHAIHDNQNVAILHQAFRLFLYDKLINLNECDYQRRGKAAAMYEIGKQYFKKDLQSFELEQHERAVKRQAHVDKRLEALEAKKKELQAAGKPTKATKSPTNKKSSK
jgi:ParB family chromosome partitioning protein